MVTEDSSSSSSSAGSCSSFPWFEVYRVASKAMPGITIISDAIVAS